MQQRHWKTAERGKRRKAGYSASPDLGHVVNNHMTVIWNRWSAIRTIKISSKNLERRILARLSSFYLLSKNFMLNKRLFLFHHINYQILLIYFLPAVKHFLELESELLRIDLLSGMDSSSVAYLCHVV